MTEPQPELHARKHVAYLSVSEEMLMDCGVIPDTRPPPPPPPWSSRLRWRISDARERAARWAYRRIAGYDVPDPE